MNHIVSLSVALTLVTALLAPAEGAKAKEPQKNKQSAAAAANKRSTGPPQAARTAQSKQPSKSKLPQRTATSSKSKANFPAQRSAAVRQNGAAQKKLSDQRSRASQHSFTNQKQIAAQQKLAQSRAKHRTPLPPIATRRTTTHPVYRSSTTSNRIDSRRYESNTNNRSSQNNYYARPSYSTYRTWDTGRVHMWNNRPFHWFGGAWVLRDGYSPYDSTTVVYSTGGRSGARVSDVQAALVQEGYDPGPVDGVIGSQTSYAIEAYQSDHRLAISGRIDTTLVRSLGL